MRLSAPDFKTYIFGILLQFAKIWHQQKRWDFFRFDGSHVLSIGDIDTDLGGYDGEFHHVAGVLRSPEGAKLDCTLTV